MPSHRQKHFVYCSFHLISAKSPVIKYYYSYITDEAPSTEIQEYDVIHIRNGIAFY